METKAYYLRNEQTDADGCHAKWSFKPNWRELMDAGKSTHRGYVPGDTLVLVNYEVFETGDYYHIAEAMFALYNRGSGQEREFDGPSMSVGDLVALVRDGDVTLLQVAEFGFVPVEVTPDEYGTYETEDDLYLLNQREADDYQNEGVEDDGGEEPEFDDDAIATEDYYPEME